MDLESIKNGKINLETQTRFLLLVILINLRDYFPSRLLLENMMRTNKLINKKRLIKKLFWL